MNLKKLSFEIAAQHNTCFRKTSSCVFDVAAAIAFAVAIAIAAAVAVAVDIALAHRTYSYKCFTECALLCFAFDSVALDHRAYKISTITTLNTKLTTCLNGFGLICMWSSSSSNMGPGVSVTSWPYIRRTLVSSPSNLFTTRFGQLCHPQRGGAYPPRTRQRRRTT